MVGSPMTTAPNGPIPNPFQLPYSPARDIAGESDLKRALPARYLLVCSARMQESQKRGQQRLISGLLEPLALASWKRSLKISRDGPLFLGHMDDLTKACSLEWLTPWNSNEPLFAPRSDAEISNTALHGGGRAPTPSTTH